MGKKVTSADNQQERLKTIGWVIGFVDGEGCFCVSINRNKEAKIGWQVIPEFVVTQGEKSLKSLQEIESFFSCGKIFVNKRYDNHKEHLYRFCIRSLSDLRNKVVPFFEENPLRTAKNEDFIKFSKVVNMMDGRHLAREGIEQIARIAQTMNRKKPARFLESSETIRQTPINSGKI